MSRGLGKTQRAILDYVAGTGTGITKAGIPGWVTVAEIAEHVYGPEPTEAQVVATRRAVRRLTADGLVESQRSFTTPELGRRLPLRTRIEECAGDGCEWCDAGIARYVGLWADEPPSKQYPDWTPWVDYWVKKGKAWHCGEMAPRRPHDFLTAVIVRRPLTDAQRDAEEQARSARVARYREVAP